MLNWFAKILLVATALSPMLGAVAVNQIAQGMPWTDWCGWLLAALVLALLCFVLLWYVASNGEQHTLHVKEFESKNSEILAFLLTYLLPFLATDKLEFKGEWITGTYIMLIIVLTIVQSGAFHFNPVMGLFYHFYSVKDESGVPSLLISRRPVRKVGADLDTVRLTHNIYLQRSQSYAK